MFDKNRVMSQICNGRVSAIQGKENKIIKVNGHDVDLDEYRLHPERYNHQPIPEAYKKEVLDALEN